MERLARCLSSAGGVENLRPLRFVNKHWSKGVAKSITKMKMAEIEKEDLREFLNKLKQTFVNVQRLDVPVVWMDDDCCTTLAAGLPKLTTLELFWGDSITDAGLKALTKLPLRSLKIYHSRLITDKGVAALSSSGLEELWIYGANQVTDDGFRQLDNLKSLMVLRLMYCNQLSRWGLEPLFRRDGLQIFVRFCRRISCEISIT